MDHTRKLLLLLESDPKAISLPLLGMYVCNIIIPLKLSSFCRKNTIFVMQHFSQRFLLCFTCMTVIDDSLLIVSCFFKNWTRFKIVPTLPVNSHFIFWLFQFAAGSVEFTTYTIHLYGPVVYVLSIQLPFSRGKWIHFIFRLTMQVAISNWTMCVYG